MNWIDSVVEAYKESEAPPKFFYWSAITALSAVVRKNLSLDRYHYRLYPNVYVFLVAASGMKKSVPINFAKSVVTHANCARIISGRNSMPRIIKDLGAAHTIEGGGMIREAQGLLLSGELAAFLVKDPDALTILTDLYDTHSYEKEWINSLKGTGVDKLKAPCLCLLGATNEEHFSEAVPQNAVGGGFIARTFIVFSNQPGMLNSLTEAPRDVPDPKVFSDYLKDLSKIKGEFTWTDRAKACYDDWYYKFMSTPRSDPTGTFRRLGDQALKVAMLVSLAGSFDLKIKEAHVFEGIQSSLDCVTGMMQVTMGAGVSNLAMQTKLVLRTLIDVPDHKMLRQKLLQKFWGQFDAFDLDRMAETLAGTGFVDIIGQGKHMIYHLKPEGVEMYTKIEFNLKRSIQ